MYNRTEHYFFRKHRLGKMWNFDIESVNLIYSDCTTHHGLQCNHMGDTPEYEKIMELSSQVVKLIKEIDKLNNPSDYDGIFAMKKHEEVR